MIILLAIVVVAVIVPAGIVALVSLASKREDSARSLGGLPAGPLEAMARRMVGFHGDGVACRPGTMRNHAGLTDGEHDGTGLGGTGLGADKRDVPHLVG